RGKPRKHGKHQQAMRNALTESCGLRVLLVYMQTVEVAREACKIDDIGFGNGAPRRFKGIADGRQGSGCGNSRRFLCGGHRVSSLPSSPCDQEEYRPPVTCSVSPVMKLAQSDARKVTALAMSSTAPSL